MAISRQALVPWWPAVWLVTSAVLVLVLAQIESGWFLAVLYLGLNAGTVLYVAFGDDAQSASRSRRLTIVGWCVAVQLPAMLWLFSNARRAPERFTAERLSSDAQHSNGSRRR